ncbi:MAG: DoxX family membrane protein [Deltaproteobacteria bacterium]|jgi:uncharacterized membrane protein YphA (DoxX/SURF4 family)|nr:DoxX family membrane protein [Deltaproteobacteria bacterium]
MLHWIYKLLRWALGALFIYAGGTKLLEPQVFSVLIGAYGILPEVLLAPAAILLPILEVAAGLGILFDIRGSLAAIAGLLMVFMTVLGYGIWMGLDVDCGCFGTEDPEAKAFHGLREALFRDIAMMAGVICIYAWRRFQAIEPQKIMAGNRYTR